MIRCGAILQGTRLLLAIDIGNTNIVVGAFREETLVASWRLSTVADRTSDEYGVVMSGLLRKAQLDEPEIRGVAISSVVPTLTATFRELAAGYFDVPALVVSADLQTGVRLLAENASEVGADRIVNALAAAHRHRLPAIVVDFGTATTFDAVSAERELMGSAIAPGFHTAMEGLFRRAARLFSVELVPPPQAIGRTTVASLQSGAVFGYVGLVEGLVRRIRAEMGGDPCVIATGGLASAVVPFTDIFDATDEHLTLHGLRLFHDLNR